MKQAMRWSDRLRHDGPALAALVLTLGIALRPETLWPLMHSYIRFSRDHPLGQYYLHRISPYVVSAIVIWLAPLVATALLLVARQLLSQHRLQRRALSRRMEPEPAWTRLADQAGIGGRMLVLPDPQVYAYCAGLLRPFVCVSEGLLRMLTAAEIEAVLRHEASHARRRDPLRLFLAELLQVVLAPFPAARTLCDRIRIGVELRADRAVLGDMPLSVLASAVVKVGRATSMSPRVAVAGMTVSEARIGALLGKSVRVPFSRRDLLITGLTLVTPLGVLIYLAALPLCGICPAL